jgi:hypothetical protein
VSGQLYRRAERNKQTAHSVLTAAILLPQRLSCYWGKIVLLRMLTNLRLADLRLTTAQQRSTGQDLRFDLYAAVLGKYPTVPRWIAGWVGSIAGVDNMEKWKFFTLPGLELRFLSRPPVGSRYTDCATASHVNATPKSLKYVTYLDVARSQIAHSIEQYANVGTLVGHGPLIMVARHCAVSRCPGGWR